MNKFPKVKSARRSKEKAVSKKKVASKRPAQQKPPASAHKASKDIKPTSRKTVSAKISQEKTALEWQATFDAVTDAICLLDKNQHILRTNRAMQKMFGVSEKELQGKFCWEVVHGTKKPVPNCPVIKSLKSLKPEAMELRVKDKAYHVGAYPVKNKKGAITSIVHIIRDITDIKETEDKITNYLKQFRSISENLADGMVYQINSGRDGSERVFSYLSPVVEKFHGLKLHDALNHPELLYNQILDDDRLLLMEAEIHAFQNKTKLDQEVRVRMPSGEIRWRHFLSVPRTLGNGDVIWDGIEIDITERKQAEDRQTEERRQLDYILDVTKTRIDIIDSDFNLRYVDDSWQKVYGDPAGRKCYEYFMGRESVCEKCGIPRALETRQIAVTEEILPREGSRVIEVHTIPFQNKEGEWLVAEFNVDITQRKQAEETLKQRDAVLKKLSANVPGMIYQFLRKPDGSYSAPFATDASRDLFGCSPEDMAEGFTPIIRAVLPEDLEKLMQSIEDSARTLTIWQCEFRVQLPGKPVRWLFGNSTTEKQPDGSIIWYGFCTDITEKKLAAVKLKQSQDNYRRLFEDHSAIKLIIDPETGIIIDANHAASAYYGWTREKMRQMKISDINTLTPDEIQTEMNRARQHKRIHFEFKHRLASGDIRDVEVYSSAVDINGKEVLHSIVHDITDRKQAEDALLMTQFSVDRASFNLLWLDDDANIVYANDAATASLGYTRDELFKMKIFDLDPDFQSEKWLPHKEELRKCKSMVFESRHRRKDGSIFPVEVSCNYFEFNGRFYSCAFDQDITERKAIEAIFLESEAKFRRIAENMSGIVSEIDTNGLFLYNSPSVQTILGYDPKELIGQNAFDFVHPDDHDHVFAEYMEGVKAQTEKEVEQRYRHKDGTYIWVRSTGRPIYGNDGQNIGMIVNSIDITERKNAEEDLKRSELSLKESQAQAHMGSWTFDYETQTSIWSDEMYRMLGRDPASGPMNFDEFLELVHPDDRKRVKKDIITCFNSKAPYRHEYRIIFPDNRIIFLEARGQMMADSRGNLTRITGIIHDITERKKAEEEIIRLNETLEQRVRERTAELEAFSYSVSHDLRAPLRTIDGFGQALLEDYRDHLDEKAADYIDRIRKASAVMGNLIDDMLTLSRITRSEMDIIRVNLSNIARSILDEYCKVESDRKVRLIVADALEDNADARLMRIVLENLLANAWKFTKLKSQAEIEFGVSRHNDKTVYFVRDNGAGFDMDYAHKLFAPFQRLHNTEDFAGTGIGLAIVKRIIARHGGDIWAEGTPDGGATFYFTLH